MRPAGCEPRCRACRHIEWTDEESRAQKQAWLRERLAPWDVEPLRVPALRLGYREKACLRAAWNGARWEFGVRISRDREEELLPIPGCPIQSARVNRIFAALSEELPGPPELAVAYAMVCGDLVSVVLKQKVAPALQKGGRPLLKELGVRGFFWNLNPSAGNRVFASKAWVRAWGEEHVQDAGLWHGPDTFRQLIREMQESALDEAEKFLMPAPVLDLYSGTGASLRRWDARGMPTIGVELHADAVECARLNLGRSLVLRGKASERIPQLAQWVAGLGRSCSAFVNPPRMGLEPEVTRWLAESVRPERLAYLSCSAGTLARDLSLLEKAGYVVHRIIPYDFFPKTHHVETLALVFRGDRPLSRG